MAERNEGDLNDESKECPKDGPNRILEDSKDSLKDGPNSGLEEGSKDSPKDSPISGLEEGSKDSPKDNPNGGLEEGSKDSLKDSPNGGLEEDSKDSPKASPNGGLEEGSKDSPKDSPIGGVEEGSKDSPKDSPNDGPLEGAKDSPKDGPNGGLEEGSKDSPKDSPNGGPLEGAKDSRKDGLKEGSKDSSKGGPYGCPKYSAKENPYCRPKDFKIDYDNPFAKASLANDVKKTWKSFLELFENHGPKYPNIAFYNNELPCLPLEDYFATILETWKGDYQKLQTNYLYTQWLFPNRRPGINPKAFVLKNKEAKVIRSTPELRQRVRMAFEMMLDFFGMALTKDDKFELTENHKERIEELNIGRSNHNYMRITRILMALKELGHKELMLPWLKFMAELIFKEKILRTAATSFETFWIKTLDANEATELNEYVESIRVPDTEEEMKPRVWLRRDLTQGINLEEILDENNRYRTSLPPPNTGSESTPSTTPDTTSNDTPNTKKHNSKMGGGGIIIEDGKQCLLLPF